jgi:death-on-curing protein
VTIIIPTPEQIVEINKMICEEGGNLHHCRDFGRVESSLHSAFYPGTYPFAHGGIAKVAGALCYYITQNHAFTDGNKRTAALTSLTFLNQNGLDLKYPKSGKNSFADMVIACASNETTKDELKDWFEKHKIRIKK